MKVKSLMKKMVNKVQDKTFRMKCYINYWIFQMIFVPQVVYADELNAEASWNEVMDFLKKWVPRLGGVLLFIGGIEFAIAYKNEDANSKTTATRLMLAGAMVMAIPSALSSLLMI